MTTVAIHLPPPMQKRAFQLMVARARQVREQGERVVLTHCAVSAGTCSANLAGSRLVCAACRHSTRKSTKDAGLDLVPLQAPPGEGPESKLSRREQCELALGAQSCLVTILRVLTRDLNRVGVLRAIKRRNFHTACILLRAMYRAIDCHSINRIEVLNGRYACMKVGVIAAEQRGLDFNTLDFNLAGQPMVFRGHIPHDRAAIRQRILQNEPDEQAAEQYYNARKNRQYNKFAKRHKNLATPVIDDSVKKKVTFFLSSEDECDSLGPEWRSPFRDTAEIVRAACQAFPDYWFCVRFHPNQAGSLSDVTAGYRGLETIPHLTIYFPKDDVNSYTLVDWSDVVVTFASTLAIESCWANKPVIEMGPSYFSELGISWTPDSVEEFLELLRADLKPKPTEPALRFANYELNDFDNLPDLDFESGHGVPVGFQRRASLVAKPAKEWNTLVTKVLRRVTAFRLSGRSKAA